MEHWVALLGNDGDSPGEVPGGLPGSKKLEGPWFTTQLVISLALGVTSFFLFCFLRTRWPMVYMPRTKLKDFSPAPAHWPDLQHTSTASRFFGWIMPTLRTSDFIVLQTVGLDASVLLSFFRMAFFVFLAFSVLATPVLIPLYIFGGGRPDSSVPAPPTNGTNDTDLTYLATYHPFINHTDTGLHEFFQDPTTAAYIQLTFAVIFTALTLKFLHGNFHRFISSRQTFALQLIHSVSARTVIVTDVPAHLQGDRALAEYFEGCGWDVESVSICRHARPLREAVKRRTEALLALERAWVEWVGNPAKAEGYDPEVYRKLKGSGEQEPLIQFNDDAGQETEPATDPEALHDRYSSIKTDRPRPMVRPRMFGVKVDAINYWQNKFFAGDADVKRLRKTGNFTPSTTAFVTFEDVRSAQASSQVVHYPVHSRVVTKPAPEPRDVIWGMVTMPRREAQIRDMIVMAFMVVLLFFWSAPFAALSAILTQRKEVKKYAPWLARIMKKYPPLNAFLQNSLPILAVTAFNALLPFFLEFLSYYQGFKARSTVECSLTRKHYLFLLISVLFVFLFANAYLTIIWELADAPMKIPEKLAAGLQSSQLSNYMISYVMLQAVGLMPLQLLNIGPLCGLAWGRLWAKTPREYAEVNAPPLINYGWVYPQALLVFTLTMVYSVISPRILWFGTIYFGFSYIVYKYKLLFVYFKPYESNGEAWKITFDRILWSLVIFQIFMIGLFTLRQFFIATAMMGLLLLYTLWWGYVMATDFGPLSKYLALSSVCEVQRGETPEVPGIGDVDNNDGTLRSQSKLNHRRYAVNDGTLYVAPSDRCTDYSQPPMNNFFPGVLNTGKRRYAQPALSGKLPQPWLPAKDRPPAFGDGAASRRGVVLSLRRKVGKKLRGKQAQQESGLPTVPDDWNTGGDSSAPSGSNSRPADSTSSTDATTRSSFPAWSTPANPWSDPTPPPSEAPVPSRKLSFDMGSGIIALPDEHIWDDDEDDDDDDDDTPADNSESPESPSTYFHRPNRKRTLSGTSGL